MGFLEEGGGELKNCKLLLNKKWVFKLNIILFGCFAPGCGWSFFKLESHGVGTFGIKYFKNYQTCYFFQIFITNRPPTCWYKTGIACVEKGVHPRKNAQFVVVGPTV